MISFGSGPIRFRKEDIAEADDRTSTSCWSEFSGINRDPLLMPKKLWIKCESVKNNSFWHNHVAAPCYGRDVKLFSAKVEGFCLKGFITMDILAPRLGREKAIMDGSSPLRKVSEAKAKSMPLQLCCLLPPPMNVDKEIAAEHNKALSDILGTNKAAEYVKEVLKFPKVPCPQVPLSELEKAACEFETRKMMLFGQGCKGMGLSPITITDGSPPPSYLISSTRAPKAVREAENDDLDDALIDLEDYADAALDDAEAELDGEESDVNLKDSNDEKDGWFDSVKSCFRNNCSKDNIEEMGSETEIPTDQEDGLEGLGENSERNEKVADGADCFEIPVHSNFMTRAEPFTSD
ncbi:hypothetical protein LINPERHAP1_LOCUS12792 [Linum perenne]